MYDAEGVSLVVGNKTKSNPAHHVDVEDCTVYGQRMWGGNEKAMILAGGYGHDIKFKNCNTYSVSPNNNDFYSPADHYDTDNATNVEYHNCTANGSGTVNNSQNRKGKGFWNEAGGPNSPDHETSATYYNCEAIQTGGGLGVTENSSVEAHNFNFNNCGPFGWAARCQGFDANFEIYDSTFDDCDEPVGTRKGGVHFSSGDGVVENCTFINNSNGYNVSFYTEETNSDITVTLENNSFDRGAESLNSSKGTGTIYIIDNDLGPNASYVKSGNYNWIGTGTTTAVNSPNASTAVSVLYQNHETDVQYNNGESLDNMLYKMRDAVNADSAAYITAEIEYNYLLP